MQTMTMSISNPYPDPFTLRDSIDEFAELLDEVLVVIVETSVGFQKHLALVRERLERDGYEFTPEVDVLDNLAYEHWEAVRTVQSLVPQVGQFAVAVDEFSRCSCDGHLCDDCTSS